MEIRLAYGKNGLPIQLLDAWDVDVVEPAYVPGLPDPTGSIRQVLKNPMGSPALRERARPGDRVGVVFSDITRPTPNHLLIPAVLAELDGLPRENITLFNALGTHRPNTEAELRGMLGDDVVNGWRIVQNNAFDPTTQVRLGVSSRGNEIWVNRELVECDLKILTGFIEPHFFAGFSGGGKALIPGMGGQDTVLRNHNADMIGDPGAAWGVTWGNPIWEEIHEAAGHVENLFLLNVTLNRDKQITAVFSGDLDQAHAAGCEFVRETAMAPVSHTYDIVITSNSGYPLDLNLYQSVKGMSAAAQVVQPGGAILIAAECWDGIPDHGLFGELLREADSPRALLERIQSPGFLKQDQWQAQIQAQILLKSEVYVYSDHLTDEEIESALFKPCRSIEATTAELVSRFGQQASICVLPEGPQTIPYLQTVNAAA